MPVAAKTAPAIRWKIRCADLFRLRRAVVKNGRATTNATGSIKNAMIAHPAKSSGVLNEPATINNRVMVGTELRNVHGEA